MALSELQVDRIMDNIAWQRVSQPVSDTIMGYASVFIKANATDKRLLYPSAVKLIENYHLDRYFLR